MRLCLALGVRHPDYLDLTAEQLLDWQDFYRKTGFGYDRDDIHWGMAMAMFANAHKKDDCPTNDPRDFMPYFDKFETELTNEDMFRTLKTAIGVNHGSNSNA